MLLILRRTQRRGEPLHGSLSDFGDRRHRAVKPQLWPPTPPWKKTQTAIFRMVRVFGGSKLGAVVLSRAMGAPPAKSVGIHYLMRNLG
eukprot:1618471-Pyramimonas_sp.AAC.1